MTVRATYTCDCCKKDLTFASSPRDQRLAVVVQSKIVIPGTSLNKTAKEPLLLEPLHFCDRACLKKWAAG
jgi:hypothetical protein